MPAESKGAFNDITSGLQLGCCITLAAESVQRLKAQTANSSPGRTSNLLLHTHLPHRRRRGQRSTELRVFQGHGDEDDEEEDDGRVDGQSGCRTPAVNHSLLAVSPPAAALTHYVCASPAAAKKREGEEKKRKRLEISKEDAVKQAGLRRAVLISHPGSRWRSSSTCRPPLSLPEEIFLNVEAASIPA